ncbi:MAG: hypothetical protein Q9218_007426 [Villophora microphyllina]
MVKWGPDVDQVLLLKIIETTDLTVDVKKISETWPDHLERPTPRAIQERIKGIRASVGAQGNGKFKIVGKADGASDGPKRARATKPSTKPARAPKASAKKVKNTNQKRKRGTVEDESDESETGFKTKGNGTDASDSEEKPVTKPKKSKVMSSKELTGNERTLGDVKEKNVENGPIVAGKGNLAGFPEEI